MEWVVTGSDFHSKGSLGAVPPATKAFSTVFALKTTVGDSHNSFMKIQ